VQRDCFFATFSSSLASKYSNVPNRTLNIISICTFQSRHLSSTSSTRYSRHRTSYNGSPGGIISEDTDFSDREFSSRSVRDSVRSYIRSNESLPLSPGKRGANLHHRESLPVPNSLLPTSSTALDTTRIEEDIETRRRASKQSLTVNFFVDRNPRKSI